MLRTDLLLGDFETAASVYRWDCAELLRMEGPAAGVALVYVPEADERGRREREMMDAVKFPGVPECRRTIEAKSGATALIFEGAQDARPLALVHDLPEPALRAGLVSMLATLRFVHSRGVVHGRIDRSVVLVDPSGRFWLTGWADARPASSAQLVAGVMGDVSVDLRDLARAFREALLRRPWPDPEGSKIHERDPRTPAGQELIDAGVKVDRDFARVLSRLVTADPRDAYLGATDVLADVGAVAVTAFDPWECVRPIGARREVARVMRFLDSTREPTSETVRHASSVDFVAPDGGGKSRLLAEIARVARSRDAIVLTAEGGARGAWGGVGALTRQLVQLLGRSARTCMQHEEALRHLLGEHDAPPPPAAVSLPGLDGRDSLISSCTAAVTDLVRIAFRRTPGILLLDDEDRLPQAARNVWRSTGQFVQAVNGGGGVLQALLVSTSTKTYPAELAADRIVVPMRSWRQRDLEKFLAGAFGAPGGARDASVAIHRITGGRPGDIVGYLRDLERKGGLQREGLRWRLTAPLCALPPLAGDQAEQVRRALESCGRDASSLVECLAVARDLSLAREALGAICDVRGPRLASAADAAVAAGLLEAHGAAWRVRTDAVAHKVYAATPDDRRRILHREVLTHLLEVAPDAIDPIAVHARASSDPRAAAWTQQAIARARERGQWATALGHLDEAATSIGRDFIGSNAVLDRADLLYRAGRLADAICVLQDDTLRSGPENSTTAAALVLLARSHYDARQWDSVIALQVPPDAVAPQALAEVRYIRASAYRHMSMTMLAHRESRLAVAELDEAPSLPVRLAHLEFQMQCALYEHDFTRAARRALDKARLSRRAGDHVRCFVDLVQYANVLRRPENPRTGRIICRLVSILRKTHGVGTTAKSRMYMFMGLAAAENSEPQRALRHLSRSHFYAQQSGIDDYACGIRIAMILRALCGRGASYDEKRLIASIAVDVCSRSLAVLASIAFDLSYCLAYYALQDNLEQLWRRVSHELEDGARFAPVRGMAIVGRIWLGEDPTDLVEPIGSADDAFSALCDRLDDPDMRRCAVGHVAVSGGPDSARQLNPSALVAMAEEQHDTRWGGIYLALSLALWIPIPFDEIQWQRLVDVVRAHVAPLPVALEWQRQLMESRHLQRASEWHRGEARRKAAEAQLELLARPEHGTHGMSAYVRWKRVMDLERARRRGEATSSTPTQVGLSPAPQHERSSSFHACLLEWCQDALKQATESPHVMVISRHRRELMMFADHLDSNIKGGSVLWRGDTLASAGFFADERATILCSPDLWPVAEVRAAIHVLGADAHRNRRLVTLLSTSVSSFRDQGPAFRALSELVDGCLVTLPPMCQEPSRRPTLFSGLAGLQSIDTTVDPAALAEIVRYEWPGGLAEMEQVLSAATGGRRAHITLSLLEAIGWRVRAVDEFSSMTRLQRKILTTIPTASSFSITELAVSLGTPTRTVLRQLAVLIDSGRVVRSGKGRATRYGAAAIDRMQQE